MSLLVSEQPPNLRLSRKVPVDSDMFNICERVKEVSERLTVVEYDPPVQFNGKTYVWAVQEQCDDRVERLVCRVEELDARVIEHLQYLIRVPFAQRFAEAERLEAAAAEAHEEEQKEQLYEQIGRPMLTDLERCGFTQRGISYPKRGVRAR